MFSQKIEAAVLKAESRAFIVLMMHSVSMCFIAAGGEVLQSRKIFQKSVHADKMILIQNIFNVHFIILFNIRMQSSV